MPGKILRGAIVGASTLLGKDLAEELSATTTAVWDITLLDAEAAAGTFTAAGDEAMVIQPLAPDSVVGIDAVFFAGEGAIALQFWQSAQVAGAAVIDLTGALEGHPNVQVRSPLVTQGLLPDIATTAVVSAHPAAIMLALVTNTLRAAGLQRLAATVLQPASELGNAGVEEVHQQTVSLLSFKPLPKDIYDAQVAFNLVASLGSSSKVSLQSISDKILRHTQLLTSNTADPVALQLLQAPVFHGYTASVFIELSQLLDEESLRQTLIGQHSQLFDEKFPSNEVVAGRGEILLRVTRAKSKQGSAFWLWMAADNLRLSARNAVACAVQALDLKPTIGVQ